jgi:serine/threonine-protein kinase HipA
MASTAYGEFGYVRSWLENKNAFPLDPVNLPLIRTSFATRKRGLLHGPFADSTPDRWGRRLVEAFDAEPKSRSAADWLVASDESRVGCLAFSTEDAAPLHEPSIANVQDLGVLAESFEKIAKGERAPALHERLYRAGRSLGGARPKASVEYDGSLWIAKFQKADDEWDQCAAEHAAMRLAADCGIEAAETRLIDIGRRRAVLVKRFDREDAEHAHFPNAHFVSALSVLDIDDTSDAGSYQAIASVLQRVSSRHRTDRLELFRRMVFNVLCGNRDDHLKNHGLLHDGGGWRLSPAFDVVPQPDMEKLQAISVGSFGAYATEANCLTQAGDYGLTRDDAQAMIDTMARQMRGWREHFAGLGVNESTIAKLGRAFSKTLDA